MIVRVSEGQFYRFRREWKVDGRISRSLYGCGARENGREMLVEELSREWWVLLDVGSNETVVVSSLVARMSM